MEQMMGENGVITGATGCFMVVRLVEAGGGLETIGVVQEVGMGTSRDLKDIVFKRE